MREVIDKVTKHDARWFANKCRRRLISTHSHKHVPYERLERQMLILRSHITPARWSWQFFQLHVLSAAKNFNEKPSG